MLVSGGNRLETNGYEYMSIESWYYVCRLGLWISLAFKMTAEWALSNVT